MGLPSEAGSVLGMAPLPVHVVSGVDWRVCQPPVQCGGVLLPGVPGAGPPHPPPPPADQPRPRRPEERVGQPGGLPRRHPADGLPPPARPLHHPPHLLRPGRAGGPASPRRSRPRAGNNLRRPPPTAGPLLQPGAA